MTPTFYDDGTGPTWADMIANSPCLRVETFDAPAPVERFSNSPEGGDNRLPLPRVLGSFHGEPTATFHREHPLGR